MTCSRCNASTYESVLAVDYGQRDGKAQLQAWFTFVGGLFFTGDVLDGVGRASGFALFIEWAKVVIGPGILLTGGWELFRLYLRRKPPELPPSSGNT